MSKPPAEQITEVGSESAGDPEKAAEQSVEGTQPTECVPESAGKEVEETAQTDREGQEQPGSERAADVAEDETRPESDPVVDETRHDVGPTSELETPVEQTATMEMQVEQAPPSTVPVEPNSADKDATGISDVPYSVNPESAAPPTMPPSEPSKLRLFSAGSPLPLSFAVPYSLTSWEAYQKI